MAKPNWKNRTLWTGDNLDIMRGMNSESVDLIYLDPPFNSNRTYSAPVGSKAADAAFKDTWSLDEVDRAWHGEIAEKAPAVYSIIDTAGITHGNSMKSYLIMMAVRILEMHRLLKNTASLYLHCDPTASHYLKVLLDSVFGQQHFQNEFIWHYSGGGASKKRWAKKHDVLLFYTKSGEWTFNVDAVRTPHKWTKNQKRADGSTRSYKRGKIPDDVWTHHSVMPWAKESTGYPTQKPIELLERIIKASSSPDEIVLDPFAGCATACIASERLQRQWIGIDLSPVAATLVKSRLENEMGLFYDVIHRTDFPKRTDQGKALDYNTIKHTLYGLQEGYCNGCKVFFLFRNMTRDHIVPKSKGGPDHLENSQLLCNACNLKKGTKSQEEFIATLKKEGIRS